MKQKILTDKMQYNSGGSRCELKKQFKYAAPKSCPTVQRAD